MVTQLALTLEHDDWANSGQATFSFSLDPQLLYFQGHFPQYQILPAVAQLKLLMDALHQLPGIGRLLLMGGAAGQPEYSQSGQKQQNSFFHPASSPLTLPGKQTGTGRPLRSWPRRC